MAFEVGDAFDLAVFGHQNNLCLRLRGLNANVNQIRPGSLRKDRRDIAGAA